METPGLGGPFLSSLGLAGSLSLPSRPGPPGTGLSLLRPSRDPPEGFGAQAAASALCSGRQGRTGSGGKTTTITYWARLAQ